MFHSTTKLIASDSGIDEIFIFMHQSIMKNMKNYATEHWIILDVVLSVSIRRVNSIKNGDNK